MKKTMVLPKLLLIKIMTSFLFALLMFFIGATPGEMHPLNNGYSQVAIENKAVTYDLTVPEISLLAYDSNKDKQLSLGELNSQRDTIEKYIKSHLQVEAPTGELTMEFISMVLEEKLGIPEVTFHLRFASKSSIDSLTIHYSLLFDDVDPMHINFLLITQGQDMDQAVFETMNRVYHYEPLVKTSMLSSAWDYFLLGIKHILTGYDHLIFLISLIIVATRLKDVVKIITAFTIAHSITLFLAATGHLNVDTRWIESGIALTIAYVAAENPFIKTVRFRWLITFFFGLIHGMGFAGAISEVGLPQQYLISSLLSFNLGVETGQLGIVVLLLPYLTKMQKHPWYPRFVIGVSVIVFMVAGYWFLQRIGVIA